MRGASTRVMDCRHEGLLVAEQIVLECVEGELPAAVWCRRTENLCAHSVEHLWLESNFQLQEEVLQLLPFQEAVLVAVVSVEDFAQ